MATDTHTHIMASMFALIFATLAATKCFFSRIHFVYIVSFLPASLCCVFLGYAISAACMHFSFFPFLDAKIDVLRVCYLNFTCFGIPIFSFASLFSFFLSTYFHSYCIRTLLFPLISPPQPNIAAGAMPISIHSSANALFSAIGFCNCL